MAANGGRMLASAQQLRHQRRYSWHQSSTMGSQVSANRAASVALAKATWMEVATMHGNVLVPGSISRGGFSILPS